MTNHVHVVIAFHNTSKTINSIIGNGKRFIAYDIVKRLEKQQENTLLSKMQSMVNTTQKQIINCTKFLNHHLTGNLPGGRQGMQNISIHTTEIKLHTLEPMQRRKKNS